MALVPCPLSHALHLVIETERFRRAAEEYPRADPPDLVRLYQELRALSGSGVPTFLDTGRDGELKITFCTPHHELVGTLTHEGDGYYIYRISPLSLQSHNQIARCAAAVMPRRWHLHRQARELNRVVLPRNGLANIRNAWEQAQSAGRLQGQSVGLSSAHLSFLSNIETLIDLACDLELERAADQSSTPVVDVEPVARARAAGDFYRFVLGGPTDLAVGDYAWAGLGVPGDGGGGHACEVTEASPDALVVHFNRPVNLALLRKVEWLMPWVSTKQYRIQKEAVRALRSGRSLNPHVLSLIMDEQFEPYGAPVIHEDKAGLNSAQRTMIARAAEVPDILLALGPPGTGKTHTIRSIVRQQARKGRKVLITSKNNKAVDNVLEALEGVDALRIGREEAVSAKVRPLMVDERARELQAQILDKIAPRLADLKALQVLWEEVEQVLDALETQAGNWRLMQARYARVREDLQTWQRRRYDDVAPVLVRQVRRFNTAWRQAGHVARRANALSRRMDNLADRVEWPLIGPLFAFLWTELDKRRQASVADYRRACDEMRTVRKRVRQIWESYRAVVTSSDDALLHKRVVAEAESELSQIRAKVTEGINRLVEMMGRIAYNPALPRPLDSPKDLEAMPWQLKKWYRRQQKRLELLRDWEALLRRRHQALYSALIRMADVVGATCVGVATDGRFDDLEFDLMIADEAGQIQVMDLLVPLVRARRAVLVGDHKQLPPFVDQELVDRIEPEDAALLGWVEESLFEHLFARETTPDSHTVTLDTQYRMPRVIADFISKHFYQGRYHTGKTPAHADPFFDSPMVFIDTKHEQHRWERPAIESEGIRGYTNELEARAIADLALAYQEHSIEWGIIVPYKKQAELIHRILRRQQHALPPAQLQDWVATVDSFQGKQRDVIIYGFTRSNSNGRVGFLSELRRLNVSLTRAKHQLVMIGDSLTLTRATSRPFADLSRSLLHTTEGLPGGYLHVREFRSRLTR